MHTNITPKSKQKNLQTRVMLVTLSIKQWSARKHDKRVTNDVAQREEASATAGRYNKQLMPKEALAFMQQKAGAARQEHYKRTMPWNDDGTRILSSDGYFEYMRIMREAKRDFELAAADFERNYAKFVEDAKKQLGKLYNSADYPAVDHINKKFGFSISITPLPDASDFRVDLPEEELQTLRSDIEQSIRTTFESAQCDVYERMRDVLGHMVTKLTEYKPGTKGQRATGTFRDSLVTNVTELLDVLPSLNVTGDAHLNDLRMQVADLLQGVDAQDLRDDDTLRRTTAAEAQAILAKVSDYLA